MQIGIVGTFDVENYGDLLFPLLAERELRARLGDVTIRPFSYHAKSRDAWPYEVTGVERLPELAADLDGLLIGGGFLIRFDKEVAPDYGPADPSIHHPTGYWLTPALIAQQHGVPVVWNAPGMHCNDIPAWAEPLMEVALGASAYVAVRDEPSRAVLERFAGETPVHAVPDTGFGVARLITAAVAERAWERIAAAGITKPYIVVQTANWETWVPRFLAQHEEVFGAFDVLALPIGPVLGEPPAAFGAELPRIKRLATWPDPLTLAGIVSEAVGVVGHSYHLAITALASGVPVFTPVDLGKGKFTALEPFATVHSWDERHATSPEWFRSRLGKATPAEALRDTLARVDAHWDRTAEALRDRDRKAGAEHVGRLLQTLPGLLEPAHETARPLLEKLIPFRRTNR